VDERSERGGVVDFEGIGLAILVVQIGRAGGACEMSDVLSLTAVETRCGRPWGCPLERAGDLLSAPMSIGASGAAPDALRRPRTLTRGDT